MANNMAGRYREQTVAADAERDFDNIYDDIYAAATREVLVDDDVMSAEEEGFMNGYDADSYLE